MRKETKTAWRICTKFVNNQFAYGGKKYAHSTKKEATDVLFDAFSKNWLFGTMAKYIMRTKNLKRERDSLKILCYCFILWVKRGFHIDQKRIAPINTTVDVKLKVFDEFMAKAEKQYEDGIEHDENINWVDQPPEAHYQEEFSSDEILDKVFETFEIWANKDWERITEFELLYVYNSMFNYWFREYKDCKEHDEDVYNETKEVEGLKKEIKELKKKLKPKPKRKYTKRKKTSGK